MYLYFARHGMPDYELNVLTEEGRRQAELTSLYLKDENIEQFFVSPSGRAKETAKRTLEKVNKKATIVPWMDEDYLWKYTVGKDEKDNYQWFFWLPEYVEAFKKNQDNPKWYEDELLSQIPLHEGIEIENNNVDEWLLSIGIKRDRATNTFSKVTPDVPEKIGVFAHGAMAYAFLSIMLGITYLKFSVTHNCLDTCGICILKIDFDVPGGCQEIVYNKKCY